MYCKFSSTPGASRQGASVKPSAVILKDHWILLVLNPMCSFAFSFPSKPSVNRNNTQDLLIAEMCNLCAKVPFATDFLRKGKVKYKVTPEMIRF